MKTMVDAGSLLLRRARALGTRLFHRFGLHCATHQIRIILISCVVITSLFYPALAIYSSSQPQSFSASRILGFLARTAVPSLYAEDDLHNIWVGHDAIRVRDDAFSRSRCGVERTLRVERILIQSPLLDDDGALNNQILLSTLHFEQRIETALASRGMSCLKLPGGRCFVLSPLIFWNHDKTALLSDRNILDTLNLSENITVSGIPITPQMVLAGRGSHEHVSANFDYATYLALTYYFNERDCLEKSHHIAWLQIIEDAATQIAELEVQAQEPTLIALEFEGKVKGFSLITAFMYFTYITFFAYVALCVRRMNSVHSRIGLTFTALVEIAVSTITSLSVCALGGFKITMVPWKLLPIVIVFVGAENMFNLVDAVGKTSVTLPVKERIALGLSRAGTSNTLKVVSYNAILGVIAVISAGAIRQFCAFAIVVLVAHWFLAHTFFLAVLSIDIQRLELEELLRQNASLAPNVPPAIPASEFLPRWRKAIVAAQNLLNGRATKNLSLFLLLAITGALYYTTYPTRTRLDDVAMTQPRRGALSRAKNPIPTDSLSPVWHIWQLLNPMADPFVHLRLEVPVILTFRLSKVHVDQFVDKALRLRSVRFIRLTLWLLKIVVLPIAATTGLLYCLLLYLLKNAELLEAQRNRAEDDAPTKEEQSKLEDQVSFTTLPRVFPTDVELIAASKDGNVIAAVGLQNEVTIWRLVNYSYICIDTTDILLRAASTSSTSSALTAVAVDVDGKYCAIGTGAGMIAVWAIAEDFVQPLPHLIPDKPTSGVTKLEFISEPLCSRHATSDAVGLLAMYDSGVAAKWTLGTGDRVSYVTPSHARPVTKSMAVRVEGDDRLLVAHAMDDGTVELTEVDKSDSLLMPGFCVLAGSPTNRVSTVHACRAQLGGRSQLIVGVSTEVGVVSIWDGLTGECISILEETFGDIGCLKMSPILCETCHYCGELPCESFSISISVGHIVLIYKACIPTETRRCACARHPPRHVPVPVPAREIRGRRSRSGSTAAPIAPSPIPWTKLPPLFDAPPFPVSAHGVHSRRASEKDPLRRASDVLSLPTFPDEHDMSQSSLDGQRPPSSNPSSSSSHKGESLWQNLVIVRAMNVTCEKGSWNTSNHKIVGVRRKLRRTDRQAKVVVVARQTRAPSQGLTVATLDRWELWTFDPLTWRLQSSPLLSLVENETNGVGLRTKDCAPRLPFTHAFPFLVCGTSGLVGFGNTIGIFRFSSL